MRPGSSPRLPRLFDSADDLAFDEEDDVADTLVRRRSESGIATFLQTVVRELEDTERRFR